MRAATVVAIAVTLLAVSASKLRVTVDVEDIGKFVVPVTANGSISENLVPEINRCVFYVVPSAAVCARLPIPINAFVSQLYALITSGTGGREPCMIGCVEWCVDRQRDGASFAVSVLR